MRIIALGGEPATGKSTLVTSLLRFLSSPQPSAFCKTGLVCYHQWAEKHLIVLGDYRKAGFSGTDRLSMAVQPQAVAFLKTLSQDDEDWTVLFEGDRLFNVSFLEACQKFSDISCWVLTAKSHVKTDRHKQRQDQQDDIWLRGRESKVANVAKRFDAELKPHNTPEDTRSLVAELEKLLSAA